MKDEHAINVTGSVCAFSSMYFCVSSVDDLGVESKWPPTAHEGAIPPLPLGHRMMAQEQTGGVVCF